MANRSVLTGRLTADPELRHTPDNTPVTSFTIAVPRKYKKNATDFIDIVAWRKEAEFVCQYFSKGKWIEVDGSIQTREYTDKSNNKRKAFEIVADNLGFVGDKPKDEIAGANNAYPPPPAQPPAPAGFDPFAGAPPLPPVAPAGFPGAAGSTPQGYGAPPPLPAYAGFPAGSPGYEDVDADGDLRF